VDDRWCEFQPVPPHYVLHVVSVGPEGVEDPIRAGRHIGVITKEPATEATTCVDVLSAHGVCARAQVADDVVQPPYCGCSGPDTRS